MPHDLAALLEAYCRYEFEMPDVDAIMAITVAAPYVDDTPTRPAASGAMRWSASTSITS